MNIFKRFFQRNPEQNPRDIVYEFASVLAKHNEPILDANLLPRSKEEIYDAFRAYILHLREFTHISEDYTKELNHVESNFQHIAAFQEIDPEDKAVVREINIGKRFAPLRKPTSPEAIKNFFELDPEAASLWGTMTKKYLDRTIKEMESH